MISCRKHQVLTLFNTILRRLAVLLLLGQHTLGALVVVVLKAGARFGETFCKREISLALDEKNLAVAAQMKMLLGVLR